MIKFIRVTIGHYNVALEHCKNHGIEHKTTWMQAIRTTLSDMVRYKTIEIDGAYVVYDVRRIYTLGMFTADIKKIYVPVEKRNTGLASRLRDMIPYDLVFEEFDILTDSSKYVVISNNCIVRPR